MLRDSTLVYSPLPDPNQYGDPKKKLGSNPDWLDAFCNMTRQSAAGFSVDEDEIILRVHGEDIVPSGVRRTGFDWLLRFRKEEAQLLMEQLSTALSKVGK